MHGPTNLATRILTQMLYSDDAEWLTRHPAGVITVTCKGLAESIRKLPQDVHPALVRLKEVGLITWFQYHKTYAVVKLRAPAGATYLKTTINLEELRDAEDTRVNAAEGT